MDKTKPDFVHGRDEWWILKWETVSGAPRYYNTSDREDVYDIARRLKELGWGINCVIYHVIPKQNRAPSSLTPKETQEKIEKKYRVKPSIWSGGKDKHLSLQLVASNKNQ